MHLPDTYIFLVCICSEDLIFRQSYHSTLPPSLFVCDDRSATLVFLLVSLLLPLRSFVHDTVVTVSEQCSPGLPSCFLFFPVSRDVRNSVSIPPSLPLLFATF